MYPPASTPAQQRKDSYVRVMQSPPASTPAQQREVRYFRVMQPPASTHACILQGIAAPPPASTPDTQQIGQILQGDAAPLPASTPDTQQIGQILQGDAAPLPASTPAQQRAMISKHARGSTLKAFLWIIIANAKRLKKYMFVLHDISYQHPG